MKASKRGKIEQKEQVSEAAALLAAMIMDGTKLDEESMDEEGYDEYEEKDFTSS